MFYRLETGKSPVEIFFDSLTNKQFEKIAFVLDLVERIDIVPRKYLKTPRSKRRGIFTARNLTIFIYGR